MKKKKERAKQVYYIDYVGIQLDSLVLVGILRKQFQCPWHIRREMWQIWQLLGESPRIVHCYKEANKVADILSNVGVAHPDQQVRVYDHIHLIPQLARGEIRLDRLGLPSVRKLRMVWALCWGKIWSLL